MPVVFVEDSDRDLHEDGVAPVLEPDHPLLAKFQQSLKEHLSKQIQMAKNDVFEMETGAKKKNVECEQLGMEAYEAQQLINRQHKDLEERILELDKICCITEELDCEMLEDKKILELKNSEVYEAETKDIRLRKELEGLNLLAQQMRQWETDLESELTINQRVFEKTKKDKVKLAEEKRQLDMLVYKLMSEVWHLEEELEMLDVQLSVKEEEREKLAESVVAANIDIESINSELKCITHSWNSVVVATSQRDRHYNTIKEELETLNERLSTMHSEVKQLTKMCTKENIQNQRLTEIKDRLETDIENSKVQLQVELSKRDAIEMEMTEKQILMDRVEHDCKRLEAENANKASDLVLLTKTFEKACRQKKELDDEMLSILDQQLTNDKAAKHLNKLVKQTQEKNRSLEIMLAKLENSQAKAMLDIEAQKCLNEEIGRFLLDVTQQQKAIDDDLKRKTAELEKLRVAMSRRQKDSNVLANKIEAAINKAGGEEISPEEMRIRTLETNIEEIRQYIKSQQKFWLRQQGHIVALSEQRQEQICDIDILNKQLLLLIQKNLKVTNELDAYNKSNEKMDRLISKLHASLLNLNEKMGQKKENRDVMEKANEILQQQYLSKLQENEMESLKLEEDITDIEEDKTNLSEELIAFNREALTWEKKLQMMVEAKKNMNAEQSGEGEIGKMRAEIHRMEVRFSQLSHAQDKLIHDLDFCISRREGILTTSYAKQRNIKNGFDKVRINVQRKLDDLRNQLKQNENEIEGLDKKMEEVDRDEREVADEMGVINGCFDYTKRQMRPTQEKIAKLKIDKQMKLDLLVLKQKKLKIYSELAKNRMPYITYKTESAIVNEQAKQQSLNKTLTIITNNLLTNFPKYENALIVVSNTLRLPAMHV